MTRDFTYVEDIVDALLRAGIREEAIGEEMNIASDAENNALKNAPHTALQITSGDWPHPYSRKEAAFPAKWVEDAKYWPPVTRIDNAHGDRNLICTCAGVEQYQDA